MLREKKLRRLSAFLAKSSYSKESFSNFLSERAGVIEFKVLGRCDFDGILFVKENQEKIPEWKGLLNEVVGEEVEQISNKSSSAVILVRVGGRVLAFAFGYGRHMLNPSYFEQDFGLKTALNTLDHQSLHSIDLYTLEEQPIQKKSQATRGSEASIFGIDIFRDVLRSVTGTPRMGVSYSSVSGADSNYSFSLKMVAEDIPKIALDLISYYGENVYQESFGWVDNIRRVREEASIKELDLLLVDAVKNRSDALIITLPEIIQWDHVLGFSFTRSKSEVDPIINTDKYLRNINKSLLSIDSIKRDRVYVIDVNDCLMNYSVYKSIYFEYDKGDVKNILYGGNWYELDKFFMDGVNRVLDCIGISDIDFPEVQMYEDDKIESEADYNIRVSNELGFYLLDKRLVKSSKTTTPIELCDILTRKKQLIHVKHRKGGSAGLSHLFSQGSVSAEVMLGDRDFRKDARRVLRSIEQEPGEDLSQIIPLDNLKSSDYEVIFLIIGVKDTCIKEGLPFFSKVNVTRIYENLTQKGFSMKIAGAKITKKTIN